MKTIGSLFTGIGGFDLGFERAGFRVAWQVEMDRQCRKLLARRFFTHCFRDVRKEYHLFTAVDVLVGGDPCPKHSRARSNGKSRHLETLWPMNEAGLHAAQCGMFWPAVGKG